MTDQITTGGTAITLRGPVPWVIAVYVVAFFGLLPLLLWTLGGRLDAVLALPAIQNDIVRACGMLLAAAGFAWMAWSMILLRRIGAGLPISHLPPTRLVARGPYRWMRHPIYVGYVAALVGAGAAAGSVGRGVLASALLAVGSLIYALGFEEPKLVRRYGAAYRAYRESTPVFPVAFARGMARVLSRLWALATPGLERFANRTVLFQWGLVDVVTYGAFAAAGAFLWTFLLAKLLIDDGLPRPLAMAYILLLALAVPAGSRLMWLLYHAAPSRRQAGDLLRRPGFVSWGGILFAFACAGGFAWWAGVDPLRLMDRTYLSGMAGYALMRLGCFTYGCCYGRPSPRGIRWANPDAKVNRERGAGGPVPRVPAPLLSSVHGAAVAGVLMAVTHGVPPAGAVTALGLVLYAAGRFGIDCLRDGSRYTPWGLTSGQLWSAMAAIAGFVLLFSVRGPSGWERPVTEVVLTGGAPLLPGLLSCAALIFGLYGIQWRRVGSW